MKALLALLGGALGFAWRNRWTFLVPVATLLLPATIYAVSLPDVYEAKAIVRVSPLSPGTSGSTLPQERADTVDEVMPTIRDRIFTRGNLERVVPVLHPEVETFDTLWLEEMAKSFAWEQTGSSTFEVSNRNPDPARAAKAVNLLLETFLEGEREERERRAQRDLTFHEAELERSRGEHAAARDRVSAFRAEHEDTLPDRKDAINGELSRLQVQIATEMGVEGAARQRLQMLDDQLITLASQPLPAAGSRTSAMEESLQLQLAEENRALKALEQELAQAMATKTERHPDVIRLRSAVAVHRQALAQTTGELDRVRRESQETATRSVEDQLERRRGSLTEQRTSVEAKLRQSAEALAGYRARVETLQGWLAGIPATRAALEPLERDLDQVGKQLEARERAAIDARSRVDYYRNSDLTDVTGFKVNTWAVVPVKTAGPGRWRFFATALALGLLIGYGLYVLKRRHEGGTIASPDDLAGLFPAAVVVTVPLLGPGRRHVWRHRLAEIGLTAYVVVLIGASVFFIAAQKGWVARPEWLQGLFGGSA